MKYKSVDGRLIIEIDPSELVFHPFIVRDGNEMKELEGYTIGNAISAAALHRLATLYPDSAAKVTAVSTSYNKSISKFVVGMEANEQDKGA